MSEANLEGVADVLEELATMKQSDPEGYEAVLQDIRTDTEEDTARRHGQALLEQIQASRSEARGNDILQLISQAHREASLEQDQP